MLEPQVKSDAESVVFRFSALLNGVLWATSVVGVLLVLVGVGLGVQGIAPIVLGLVDSVLCVRITTARTRVDHRGIRIRIFRSQFITVHDIASLTVRRTSRNGLHRDKIIVERADGSQIPLDMTGIRCPPEGSEWLQARLGDMNGVLGLPTP